MGVSVTSELVGPPVSAAAIARANPRTVLASSSTEMGSSIWKRRCTRAIRRTAVSESPPSSKKSSVTDSFGATSSSLQRSESSASSGLSGAQCGRALIVSCSGCGSARRSSLRLGVSGSASRTVIVLGIMCAGKLRASALRKESGTSTADGLATT
jgi:hypothetical protein